MKENAEAKEEAEEGEKKEEEEEEGGGRPIWVLSQEFGCGIPWACAGP